MNNAVNNLAQCWGCPVFDRLFQIISVAAGVVYDQMVNWAWIVLVGFWAFYLLWVVWQNMKGDGKDFLYQESIKPAFIYSLVVCALLALGAWFPKFISTITFEPVAEVATLYADAVLQTDTAAVEQKVIYKPQPMNDDGIFRPELRDKIIVLMKTTITQFQSMIKLGLAVMENAFSRHALAGIAALLKHILMFVMGAYLAYQFFLLFMRYCFYFLDVIVHLAMFAFFFPFVLVFFVFKHSQAAEWVTKMGDAFTGGGLIKKVFSSIVALAAAVVVYTIVMVIIAKFFASGAMSSNEIVRHILDGTISGADLSDENLTNITLMGCILIGFLANYLTGQVKKVGDDLWAAFAIKPAAPMGEQLGKDVEQVAKNIVGGVASKIGTAMGIEKKDEKKEEKKP